MSTAQVGFTIDGGWLADFARTRLEEGDWDRGLSLLTDSLEGLTVDQAISIIKGEATLAGNSNTGIDIVPLPAGNAVQQRISQRLHYLYGRLFRYRDIVYRPYAIVSGWCRDDFTFACTYSGSCHFVGVETKLDALRSFYYAKNKETDMLVRLSKPIITSNNLPAIDVLCEQVTKSAPFWYQLPVNDPVSTIEKQLKRHNIPVIGAHEEHLTYSAKNEAHDYTVPELLEQTEHVVHPATAVVDAPRKLSEAESSELTAALFKAMQEFLESGANDLSLNKKINVSFEQSIDKLQRHLSDADWDTVAELRVQFEALTERLLGEQIRAQAMEHGGFIDLKLVVNKDGKEVPYTAKPVLKVPKNPFILWCLRNFDFEAHGHERPVWNKVTTSGMKMYNDDPYHSDWMLGAGVPLEAAYDEDSIGGVVRHAAYAKMHDLSREYSGHAFTVLAKTEHGYYMGSIVHAVPGKAVPAGSIAVAPTAGPEYQLAMESASKAGEYGPGCIICETGGKLAHLSIVGRELSCLVLMLPNACAMYHDGDRVFIDIAAGTIVTRV